MFKLFRKFYFKIYHLLKLISVFIIIFTLTINVYAEELSVDNCYVDYYKQYETSNDNKIYYYRDGNWYGASGSNADYVSLKTLFNYEPGVDYYIKLPGEGVSKIYLPTIYLYNSNNNYSRTGYNNFEGNLISRNDINLNYYPETNIIKINITNENYDNFSLSFQRNTYSASWPINRNLTGNLAYSTNNLSTCPTPSEPEEPTPDNTYSNFLTLYISKIDYLAKGFTENPYLLAMLSIIFGFIVLELFLKIFHLKGGYKK